MSSSRIVPTIALRAQDLRKKKMVVQSRRYKAEVGQLRLLVADWKSCRFLMQMTIRLDRVGCFFALLMLLMRARLV